MQKCKSTATFLFITFIDFRMIFSRHLHCIVLWLLSGREFSLEHILHKILHEFVNVFVELGGGFDVVHLVLVGEGLSFLVRHFSLLLQVDFVTHQHLHNGRIRMLVDALEPSFHIREGERVSHVKSYNYAIRLLVERIGNGLEPFLAGSIPDLDSDILTNGRLISGRNVIQAYGRHVALSELFFRIPI